MKKWAIVLLILFIVIVLAVLVFAVKRWIDLSIVDKDGMVRETAVERVAFSSSGGMRGGHTYITAGRDPETDEITVDVNHQEYWKAPEEISQYKANPELFDEIEKLIVESSFWNAEKRPLSKDVVLDGPIEELRIKMRDGLEFKVSNDLRLSDGESDAWYGIIKLLKDEGFKAE